MDKGSGCLVKVPSIIEFKEKVEQSPELSTSSFLPALMS
jgi:hypothetical protein